MYGTRDMAQWLTYANRNADKAAATLLNAAAGDVAGATWAVLYPCAVKFFGIEVTTAFNYNVLTQEGRLTLERRLTPGSDTGRVEVARIDLPNLLTVGHVHGVLYEAIGPDANLLPGNELVLRVVIQAQGGAGIAGAYRPVIILAQNDEVPENAPLWSLTTVVQNPLVGV